MPNRRFALAALAAAFLALAGPATLAAQTTDIIRGRVTGPDSLPIFDVIVTATSISGNVNRTTRTDRNGRYTLTIPNGDGDYLVSFAALGFAARRFQVKRVADEDVLIADARLQRVNAVLDAVEVVGDRQRPRRNDATPDVSGTERTITPTEVPPNQMGDLAAMAATLPGVESTTNPDGSQGYSVLGLGADQNNTTLNGMAFDGSNLPRDAAIRTSLVTSPYDVSRGGFSGAQMSIQTRSGSNFISRTNSLNLDAPAMQWTDDAARSLGQEYSSASLGGLMSGPIVYDKTFYSVAYQLGRRSNAFESFLTADPTGLAAAGVSDSVRTALLATLGTQQIPTLGGGGLRDDRIGDNGSILGSIDLTSPSSTSGQAVNLSFNGNWGKQSPSGGSATELPAFGGDRTNWRYGLQGRHSAFFGVGILTETSLGINANRNYGTPYLFMPAGRARVTSILDGGEVQRTVSFGGNQGLNTTSRGVTVQGQNQLSWFSTNNKHRLKLASELRHESSDQLLATNTFGTFTYNSLEDLQNNTPALFTRQLAPRERDIQQLVGGVSLGDSYRPTSAFQLQYGLRLDGSRFLTAPAYNADIETLFGLRNDVVPNRLYVSPRLGFSWTYGQAAEIAGFLGAQRAPRAVVRGGVGVFQNLPSTGSIGSALDNTGLPGAAQQITCVGPAVPSPDWAAYLADPASIPETCADGTTGTPFANISPAVFAFSKDYVSPRSVRSNLQWSGPTLGNRLNTSVDLTWSLNLNQPSTVDRNFVPVTQFTLNDEGARPVFVQPGSIVPATGAIASQDARVSQDYSRVSELRSDLRSQSAQLSLRVSPTRFSTGFSWGAWYTLSRFREQFRGFTSTVNDPLAVEWGTSASAAHSVGYNLGYNFFDFLRVTWFGQFRSGARYTPMVASDINGDGFANDRAFLFDPATTSDPDVAAGMDALLASDSRAARCLRSQLGGFARRNSCVGPWTSTANMSFSFNPIKLRMPQRATISFNLSNPLGAADLIVNGSDNLRGWGQPAIPDNALLHVTGFDNSDPANPRYQYQVNSRFGSTDPRFSPVRVPVTLTAMIRFDIGPTRERQMLTQQLDRGRRTQGSRAPEMLLRLMFGNGGIPNPIATLLRQQDTLELTGPQADSLATMNREYVIKLEGIWAPIVRDFAALPDDYDHDEVYHRYIVARRQTVDYLKAMAPRVKRVLTPAQERRIPAFIASYLDPRYLSSIRSGTAGLGGGGGFAGFMPEAMARGGAVRIEMRSP